MNCAFSELIAPLLAPTGASIPEVILLVTNAVVRGCRDRLFLVFSSEGYFFLAIDDTTNGKYSLQDYQQQFLFFPELKHAHDVLRIRH